MSAEDLEKYEAALPKFKEEEKAARQAFNEWRIDFGKYDVVVSNPPGWAPVKRRGLKLARAVYSAAVQPAQPDPMITTFSMAIRCGTVAGSCRAGQVTYRL